MKSCRDAAIKLLAARDYSVSGLAMKLEQKGHSSEWVAPVLEECIEKGYLKEERYRDGLIRRLLKKNRSDWFIQAQLEKEGVAVSTEHIEEIRGELRLDPEAQIQQLIAKKMTLLPPNDPKSEEKVFRYLFSQGYTYDQSREAWNRFQLDKMSNTV